MVGLFVKILNMSIAASWIVLAVIVIRFFLKKAPKWLCCVLWAMVALRLIVAFPAESAFSLIPSGEVIPQDIVTSQTPEIHSGIPAVNSAVNPLLAERSAEEGNTLESVFSVASVVWLAGAAVMLLYSAVSGWLLRRRVKASILYRENTYVCDDVQSPFILGVFSPKIYIPSGMDDTQLQYVLAHENAHIRRHDHWWKPLSFALLAVYWFNPLLWVAYILLSRDIEQACDEKVITGMDASEKKGYSQALVACSVHRRLIMICPVAFGEIGVKARVKGVLNYKKPTFWIILASAAVCSVVAVCFLTNPKTCPHLYFGQITVKATCTQEGVETKSCTLCRHSYTVPVEACAHTYGEGTAVKPATCIEQGVRELTCTGCDATKTEAMEKAAHIPGEFVVTKEPNCSEEGERMAACTVCQALCAVEALATNEVHDLQETVLRESTCTALGEGLRTCTRCLHSEAVVYEQLSHSYVTVLYDEANCGSEGSQCIRCTSCGFTYVIEFPIKGSHEWREEDFFDACIHCGRVRPGGRYNPDYTVDFDTGNAPGVPSLPVIRIFP